MRKRMDLIGFLHIFNNISEYIQAIKYTISSYDVAIGKYIIFHDQISTKNGKLLGKKGENNYAFISMFSSRAKYEKTLKEGIIKQENYNDIDEIAENEFDEFDNLRKGITLLSYKELMNYLGENNLI